MFFFNPSCVLNMFVLVKMFRLLSFDKHFYGFDKNIEEIVFLIN